MLVLSVCLYAGLGFVHFRLIVASISRIDCLERLFGELMCRDGVKLSAPIRLLVAGVQQTYRPGFTETNRDDFVTSFAKAIKAVVEVPSAVKARVISSRDSGYAVCSKAEIF